MNDSRISFDGHEGGNAVGVGALRTERRDAAEHRQRILSCARHLFAEQNVENISMHQIAQAAGVGQGTLYRRYSNKGELCLDVLQESITLLSDDIEQYLTGESTPSDPVERLDGVIMRLVEFVEYNAPLLSVVHEAYCGSKRATQFGTPFYRSMEKTVETLLADCPTMSDQPPHVVIFTAYAMLEAVNPDLYRYQREYRGMSQADIIEGLRHIYMKTSNTAE